MEHTIGAPPRILVADTDAATREHVARVLSPDYHVTLLPDGADAVATARRQSFDLLIAGVLPPHLDRPELLAALRADDRTRSLPVVLLCASSAETSSAGLAAAVDYVVRPFSEQELRVRVAARLEIARITRDAAASVRESEWRMRLAMDAAQMFSWEVDLTTGRTTVAGNVERVLGFGRDRVSQDLTETIDALIHPDDRARVLAAIESARQTGQLHGEVRLVDPGSGTIIWVEAHGTVVRDGAAQPLKLIGVTQNITARKQSEAAIERGREQLQLVSDNVPALISYVDHERCYRWCNRTYTDWFGVPVTDVVGRRMRDVVGEEAWQTIGPHIDAALGGERVEYEAETRYRTGGPRWIHAVYTPHRDEAGVVLGAVIMVHDVTESRRAAEAVRESTSRFDLVKDGAEVGFWFCDLPFDKLIWDNRVKEHFWLPPDAEVTIDRFYEQLHPDDRERTRQAIDASIANRTQYDIEYRTRSSSGDEKWIRAIGRTFYDAHGSPTRFDGVTLDITERRAMEDALRESEERFRNMADHAPVMIWMTDPGASCTYLSKSWYDFTGQTPATGLGAGWLDATHQDDRQLAGETFLTAHAGRQPFRLDYRLRRADGAYAWAIDTGVPRFGPDGEFAGYIGSVLDITERKDMEEALRENDRRKDEFLAMLSHELRNPLAPIRNAAQVLKVTPPADPRQQWARDVIERQVQHITRLVDDLLDVSRITRSKITLQRECLDVAAVVDRAVEVSRPLIDARGQRLTVTVAAGPLAVDGDMTRLVQVVANLLNNAVKFTPEGGDIAIAAAADGPEVVLRVRDTGVGISCELLPYVFELFTQADRSLDRSQGGLGIGLTLVRLLVDLHGGRVEARSDGTGAGSEFVVRLPLVTAPAPAAAPDVAEPAVPPAGVGRQRILVVEDNVDSAEMLSVMLSLRGYETHIAHDGEEALAAAQRVRPHVVFCDIGLPLMSGYEVAQQLRVLLAEDPPRLVALSGYGQDHDRRRAAEAGFHHHLVKPVEPDVLFALLESLAASAAPEP